MKKKNMTYAEVADKLTKKIGELEDKMKSSDRFAKETAQRMLPRYQEKLDALYNEQERVKGEAFQKDMNKLKMKYGGELPKYFDGGSLMNIGMGVMQGFGQGANAEGDSAAGVKSGVDAGIAAALGPYGMLYTAGKQFADMGQDMLSDGTHTNYAGETYNTYGSDAARHAAAWMKPQHEYMIDALKKDEHGRRDWKSAGLSLIPGVQQIRAGMGNINFAYGGKLPKMQDGGPIVPQSGETWEAFLARAQAAGMPEQDTWDPETQTMIPGALNVFNNPDLRMPVQYGQSQTNLRGDARPTTPIQTDLAKQYTGPGTFQNPDGTFTTPGVAYPEQSPFTQPSMPGSPEATPQAGSPKMGWQDYLYKGAMYAPTIYNFARGLQKPQTLDHEEFQNPYEKKVLDMMANREYNIDPQLQANRSVLNNMKRNLANVAGGSAASYLSNIGKLQLNTDKMNEAAYAQKQNMDNQYRMQEAGMMGNLGAARAQTKFNIQDINDRNKAARDAYMGKAMEGVSGIAQTEKKMSNLSSRDQERLAALQAMYPDYGYTTDDRGYVTGFNYKG